MKFQCTACGDLTEDISPLGPEGIVICEHCATQPDISNRILTAVHNATLAAIQGVDTDKRIAIAKAAKAERDIDWFDAVQNTVGKRPRSRLEALQYIRDAIAQSSKTYPPPDKMKPHPRQFRNLTSYQRALREWQDAQATRPALLWAAAFAVLVAAVCFLALARAFHIPRTPT
jgi:lipopolysaccharide export LptBFGC system permease protein LptF